jgi:predicted aspartyl protease
MHRACVLTLVGLASLAVACRAAPDSSRLDSLYRAHQWLELRDAVTDQSPVLYRGAVAAALNEPAAEALLGEVIRTQPASKAADDAYGLLSEVFIRSGQYSRFLATYAAWAAAFPASAGVERERENREKFRDRPDQVSDPVRRSVINHDNDGYLTLPVSINGRMDDFILDTGAWQSAVTEPLAKKLGLTLLNVQASVTDASGTRTSFRTAVADEVVVAGTRFRHVSLAVIAGGGPFADAEVGIIGMPVLLALGHIHWSMDGTAEVGGVSSGRSLPIPNLVFDRHRLLVSADVQGRSVWATFDTGANTTQLNANFAEWFPGVVASGKRTTSEITGIGGTQSFQAVELPELSLRIASTERVVRPAQVTLQRIALMGGECCIGNAGHDLLKQGRGFTIDFSRMELALR